MSRAKVKFKELSKEEKSEKIKDIIGTIVLISFSIPITFLIGKIFTTQEGYIDPATNRGRSDYVLMLLQCVLGIVALVIPNRFFRNKGIQIPTTMSILYTLFLYCAISLGEIRNFYYVIPNWDTILHTFSGGMLGAIGFSFVSLLNKTDDLHLKLTPFFVALFAFMFSITLGVVWEVYEFSFDGMFGLNMQKFRIETGQPLVGRAALEDTMEDLIVDMVGAFIMTTVGYISLKYKKGWVEKLLIKVKKRDKSQKE